MADRIIYLGANEGVCIINPYRADGAPLTDLPIHEVARKDVPAGVPFRIVDAADIPSDRSQRDLWTTDFSKPDGYGLGSDAWAAEQVQRGAGE